MILPTINFFAIKSIAQSIAIAWQFSIKIMVIEISFAFLQSVAMGGVATSVFYDVDVANLTILASKKVVD